MRSCSRVVSSCGGWLARGGGLTVDHSFAGVHIRCCGNCGWRFRPYGDSLWQAPQRKQRSSPRASGPSPRLGVPSLRHSSGGIASGRLRSTSSRCVRLRRTALRASPLMNAYVRPPEGAGGSKAKAKARSRAAGELTLGLLSGWRAKQSQKPELSERGGAFWWLWICPSDDHCARVCRW